MATIDINLLKPGMVVNKEVMNMNRGIVLLASGTVLNRNNIVHIKNNGVRFVDILEKADEKEEFVVIKDEEFTAVQEEFANKTKAILNDIKLGKKIIVTEISDTVDELMEELLNNNNILGRIRRLKERDDYTFKHSLNVAMLATMIGKWLKYDMVELKQLLLSGLFHDIGKLKISDDIINKPERLSDKEYEIIKKHPVYGYNILSHTIGLSKNIALGALQHHEREDASGYPLGIKGNKIHEFGKIIAVCDIFDAMTSDRVYHDKQSPFLVAEHINQNSYGILDPNISLLFLNNISKFYVGNIVKLNNGLIGEIVYVHREAPTKPTVKVEDTYYDLIREKELYVLDIID